MIRLKSFSITFRCFLKSTVHIRVCTSEPKISSVCFLTAVRWAGFTSSGTHLELESAVARRSLLPGFIENSSSSSCYGAATLADGLEPGTGRLETDAGAGFAGLLFSSSSSPPLAEVSALPGRTFLVGPFAVVPPRTPAFFDAAAGAGLTSSSVSYMAASGFYVIAFCFAFSRSGLTVP